jgi:hypothetical protein
VIEIPNYISGGRGQKSEVNVVDLMEDMLFQRAASGIRPVLYVSSSTDLECSMLMLLDDMDEVHWSGTEQPAGRRVGYHIGTS